MDLKLQRVEQLNTLRSLCDGGSAPITDASVTAAKLASDAVTTDKILAANVTTAKFAAGAVTLPKVTTTGIKTLAAAGRNGAGAITLTGAAVGDRVLTSFGAPTAGGALAAPAAGVFEAAITVVNQIQQASASDLSANTYVHILIPAAA